MDNKSIQELVLGDVERTGLLPSQAAQFYEGLQELLRHGDRDEALWRKMSRTLLHPNHPFALHHLMYYSTYRDWDESQRGPPKYWFPSLDSVRRTSLGKLLEARGKDLLGDKYVDPVTSFHDFYEFSVDSPEIYWPIMFEKMSLIFHVQPRCMIDVNDTTLSGGKWLPGAVLNIAECCLAPKPSIGKTDESVAILWRDEGFDDLPPSTMTLSQLRKQVSRVANSLVAMGFRRGDAIAVDMPMHVHAVIIYLAVILAGCVVVSVPDSFVSSEIASRLRISKAKVIFTQDNIARGGKIIPLYSRVVGANPPRAIVLPGDGKRLQVKLRENDLSWETFCSSSESVMKPDEFSPVSLPVETWTNILFSSGTTAEPKAIPWNQTTPMRVAGDSVVHSDLQACDIYCWPTNLGWMMGPYLISSCLLTGATMAVYNGAPLGRTFGKFVQDAKVTILGVVPSMVKTWRKTGCMESLDWSSIRLLSTTGEASSIDDDLWLSSKAWYKPILECCGGTELGSAFLHGSLCQPQAFAAFSTPNVTSKFVLLDDTGKPYPNDQPCSGEIALFPKSLGTSSVLLNADHHRVYYEGMPVVNGIQLRRHGDIFERLVGGYYRAKGRADDSMNLGGIKIGALEIERVCNTAHSSVVETAAIALPPVGGGPDNLFIAAVLKDGPASSVSLETLRQAFGSAIQSNLNPLFKVHGVFLRPEFPRTASQKLMRRVIRAQLTESLLKPQSKL